MKDNLFISGINLSESDIIQNSLTIDRYSISGAHIEIGSAIAAELTFKINNDNGRWDNTVFEGAELFVRVNDTPLGYFTIDEPPRKLKILNIRALDRMVQFDKKYETDLNFPTTLEVLIRDCCEKCNILVGTLDLINDNIIINEKPQADTFRTVIMWCAELSGTCVYINANGLLNMHWYKDSAVNIKPSDRYDGADFYKEPIQITGIKYKDTIVGTEGYVVELVNNMILFNRDDIADILNVVLDRVKTLKYHPFNCVTKTKVGLFPLTKIIYTDKDGIEYPSIVTHHTYKLNGRSAIKAIGETTIKKGYASLNPITPHEQQILESIKQDTGKELSNYEQLLLGLNEQVNNSLGLYTTTKKDSAGRATVYSHDKPTLEESSYISVRNTGGFAWTNNGWNDGYPNWRYGIDSNGNAIFNRIATVGLDADWIKTGSITVDKIESRGLLELMAREINLRGMVTFYALDDEMKDKIAGFEGKGNLLDALTLIEEDKTVINGGLIATNTILGNMIVSDQILARHLSVEALEAIGTTITISGRQIVLSSGADLESAIGGANILPESYINKTVESYGTLYTATVELEPGEYTLSVKYDTKGSSMMVQLYDETWESLAIGIGTYTNTFSISLTGSYTFSLIDSSGSGGSYAEWIKLEKGAEATPWKPKETDKVTAGRIMLEGYTSINEKFKIDLDGSMEATAGKIGGWTITEDSIWTVYNSDGYIYNTELRKPKSSTDTVFRTMTAGTPQFEVLADGTMRANKAEIKGKVQATSFEVLNSSNVKIGGMYGSGTNAYVGVGRVINPTNPTGTSLAVGQLTGYGDSVIIYTDKMTGLDSYPLFTFATPASPGEPYNMITSLLSGVNTFKIESGGNYKSHMILRGRQGGADELSVDFNGVIYAPSIRSLENDLAIKATNYITLEAGTSINILSTLIIGGKYISVDSNGFVKAT